MSVVAKFKVVKKSETQNGIEVDMEAVTTGSEANEEFFKWTPYGTLEMGILNEKAAKQFVVGKEYYLTFEIDENQSN